MLWNELVLGAVMSQSNCKDTSGGGSCDSSNEIVVVMALIVVVAAVVVTKQFVVCLLFCLPVAHSESNVVW